MQFSVKVRSGKLPFYERADEHNEGEIRENVAAVRAKIVLVLGPLGSGKTSFIKGMLNSNGAMFGKLRLIINDVGAENIDAGRLAEDVDLEDEKVSALKSGCICCEDLESLVAEVKKNSADLDTILIEPTGIAEGDTIVRALDKLGMQTEVVTLMDALHHSRRTEVEKQIIDTQVAVAKVIGLTWWEKASAAEIEETMDYIGEKNSEAPIIKLPKLNFTQVENLGGEVAMEYKQLMDELMMEKQKMKHRKAVRHHHHHEHSHQAPVFSKSFVDINENFSVKDLENLLATHKDVLIRAKGVVAGRRFNYVHGDLVWEKAALEKSVLNFISSRPVDVEQLNDLLKKEKAGLKAAWEYQYQSELAGKINQYLNMDKIAMLKFVEEEVAKLVGQYKQWMDLEMQINQLKNQLPMSIDKEKKIEDLKLEQKQLGEAMTFANPLIWLMYKIRAYQGTEKALQNLGDLRKHCESPTYICHKRLDYLNWGLQKRFGKNLLDDSLDSAVSLEKIIEDGELLDLSLDGDFMKSWQEYEYFKQIDEHDRMRVAKWENYRK